jgi:hypothetical protein
MTIEEIQRITKPLITARKQGYIEKTGGNGPRSTESFGEGFFNNYKDKLPPSLIGFYAITNGYSWQWEAKIPTRTSNEKNTEQGIINVLDLEDLFDEDILVTLSESRKYYIEGEEGFSKTGNFLPVDYIEDVCAGVFSKENDDDIIYFYDFGIGFYPLKINFEGYLELAFMARGYMMWPYVLVYLEYGKNDPAKFGESRYEDFSEDMPLLFPDFKMEEFIALYESLKIK